MAEIVHSRVKAHGITFHVASAGPEDAPAILFVHGFPEGWMTWRPVMQRLEGVRMIALDTRGYGETDRPPGGYDVFTLTDDLRHLIGALGLDRPLIVSHDWGGALGWIFAHRYSSLIRGLVVVNCTHPKTLVRAALHFEDWQPLRIPWVPFFMLPWLPEFLLTSAPGLRFLRWSFVHREGLKGRLDRGLVDEFVDRFRRPSDLKPPIDYYRAFVRTLLLSPSARKRLYDIYDVPISVPITVVWGEKDDALPQGVARKSDRDARRAVDWRELRGVGHFVTIEAPDLLASEIERVLAALSSDPATS